MIKTLRKKFIFFAMLAVTVLLLVLLISINGLIRINSERQADEILDTLISSDGIIMKYPPHKEDRPPMDMMRSARFFIVKADLDGDYISCDLNQIFYVSDEDAVSYASSVLSRKMNSGHIDRYKYRIDKKEDYQIIYFLDLTQELMTVRTVLGISSVIAAISWLIMLGFVVLSSKKFAAPIIAGIEKQKQFITNAGHELKTPLAIIQTNNDAMTLIYGENKYNRNIKSQVVRLGELTANLLMQARLDEEVELEKEQVNISDLTREIIQPYGDSAEARGIQFKSQIAPGISMETNRQAFTQLLTVLMDNAMKYTTDEGSVTFTLQQEAGHIIITEENSCNPDMNVNPERLFDRFYRADSARTQNDSQSGYGIGLSVARSICESLGGKLNAYYPHQGLIRFIAKF